MRQENETYKEKAGAEGSSYLKMESSVSGRAEVRRVPLTAILSECQNEDAEKQKKNESAHLDMSLLEIPLYLVLLPNVKIGLGRGHRRRILPPAKWSFVLDVHEEQGRGVEVVERGRARRARRTQFSC